MKYRSIADLSVTISSNLHKIPRDIDLVVGIPRSGMLAANIIALQLNLKITDLTGLLNDAELKSGTTRKALKEEVVNAWCAKKVLIVDDSVGSGKSIREVKGIISAKFIGREIDFIYCSVFCSPKTISECDIYFELLEQPRYFEWNIMHRPALNKMCLDIDGVICVDPKDHENDDGDKYIEFIKNAEPLCIPSYPVGHLVTSRLEKYRPQTEKWLKDNGILYGELHMLDLPDAETRRRMSAHAPFKARVYQSLYETILFIESEDKQARKIADASGKPVLCSFSQEIYEPNSTAAVLENKSKILIKKIFRKIKILLKHS